MKLEIYRSWDDIPEPLDTSLKEILSHNGEEIHLEDYDYFIVNDDEIRPNDWYQVFKRLDDNFHARYGTFYDLENKKRRHITIITH